MFLFCLGVFLHVNIHLSNIYFFLLSLEHLCTNTRSVLSNVYEAGVYHTAKDNTKTSIWSSRSPSFLRDNLSQSE